MIPVPFLDPESFQSISKESQGPDQSLVQSAAADSCATVHGNAQIEGLPFAPTVSKLGLVAMLIGLMKLNGGQIVAADGAA